MTENAATSLKGRNLKYLIGFIVLNLCAVYAIMKGSPSEWFDLTQNAIQSATASVFAGIFAIGLNGLLSSNQKAILVFWRLRHPLPGSRAFSHFLEADVRIDPQGIRSRHDPLPEDPGDQNRLWYRIYRQHQNEPSVEDAHHGYLLTRDLAALSLFFVFSLVPILIVIGTPSYYPLYYAVALMCAYIFFSHAARNYGKSLVTNVLAIESSS